MSGYILGWFMAGEPLNYDRVDASFKGVGDKGVFQGMVVISVLTIMLMKMVLIALIRE